MKALVVDDERDILEEIVSFLSRRGFEVVGAGGVDEARQSLQGNGPFDVVLTDMRMDPGTGLDVIKACKGLDDPRPAMFVVTGQASPEQIREAQKEGVASVLAKPLSLRSLLEAINQVRRDRDG